MFNWNLQPAFPVRSLRLWTSNTGWCEIDKGTASNQYNFGQLDALLHQSSTLKADVELTFGSTPQWAASGAYPQPSVTDQCGSLYTKPPANESYWTNFVTALVTHAKGKIHAYELWNEVDTVTSWSGGIGEMVRMSVDAASIIHRIDPSALVLSPSVTNDSTGYSWLHQYLSRLPAGTIDGVAVHSYTSGAWPEYTVPAEMKSVRSALPSAYVKTPIWSTEGGWGQNSQLTSPGPGADPGAFAARYDLQMLIQGFTRSYWYAYQNTQWGTLWDGTALTRAGTATATIQAWLAGMTLGGCRTTDNNLWTCDLTTSAGEKRRIVWTARSAVRYPTVGFRTVSTLDGGSSSVGGWIQAVSAPVMLSS
jgi:hypothetical protein